MRDAPRAVDTVSAADLGAHASVADGWIAVRGVVYRAMPFLKEHPGGAAALVPHLGRDATAAFEARHSYINPELSAIARYRVGRLARA
jgi:cytochrome b involved in lipid metabolism